LGVDSNFGYRFRQAFAGSAPLLNQPENLLAPRSFVWALVSTIPRLIGVDDPKFFKRLRRPLEAEISRLSI